MSLYDELYAWGKSRVKHTLWVFSDLQQAQPENAERCIDISMTDYDLLGRPAEMICYLGDSVESADIGHLDRMCELQLSAFDRLGIPLCYAAGNHDFDYAEQCHFRGLSEYRVPFQDAVRAHPGWYTTEKREDFWFSVPFDRYRFYFFSDHAAEDNRWCSTHSFFRWGEELYPYTEADYARVRQDIAACGKRVITFGHYAMPGGNRDTYLMSRVLPLPLNVRAHVYGHSHMSDYKCAHERAYSQIQWVDWHDIPQVDVSSFENIRAPFCRSVLLQIYEDDSLGFFFRNHDARRFESAFFPARDTTEKPGDYEYWRHFDFPWKHHV